MKDLIRKARIQLVRSIVSCKPTPPLLGKSIIIAPHPDDEVLGCGGLIRRLLELGRQVDVVILSGGGKSHAGCCKIDEHTLIENRRNLSQRAAQIIGLPAERLHFLNYPDGGISYDCPETDRLRQLIATVSSDAVFVPHRGEGWSDHVAAGEIVRRLVGDRPQVALYEYCVWFWYYNVWNIDWQRARVLQLSSEEHHTKLQAIDAYVTPLAPCGKPWSGVLPRVFVDACRWCNELYFRIK